MKLADALKTEYPGFLSFCQVWKVRNTEQLTEQIYAAYRMVSGYGEEYTDAIKARIADSEAEPARMMCETLQEEPMDMYRHIPVEALGFGTRASHFFQHKGIKSLYDILTCRNGDFYSKHIIGEGTRQEIYGKTREFLESGGALKYKGPFLDDSGELLRPGQAERVNLDPEPLWIPLEDEDGEMKKLASASPQHAAFLCVALRDYYRPFFAYYKAIRDMMQSCGSLPDHIKELSFGELLMAYGARHAADAKALAVWPQDKTVPAILMTLAHEDPPEPADWMTAASAFCRWLQGMDLKEAAGKIFCTDSREDRSAYGKFADRYQEIIIRRAGGERLEAIGKTYGYSRERVRQIEKAKLKRFWQAYSRNPYDLAAVMHLHAGGTMLTYEQVEGLLPQPEARLFWLMARKHLLDCSLYEYVNETGTLYFNLVTGTRQDPDSVSEAIQTLPDCFYADEVPALLEKLSADTGLPVRALEEWLPYSRKKYGQLYSLAKPDMSKKCEYLLRCCFPGGYKVGDENMAKEAARIMAETFGGANEISQHALDSKISMPGQLVDRGLYMYPGYVNMDYSVLDDVFAYIEKSGSNIIPYTELHDVFRPRLQAAGIQNRYALQGAIKRCGCPYMTSKDYILKNEDSSMAAELSAFARARGKFTMKEFADAYPYYNANLLYQLATRTDDVIQVGPALFMDASRLEYSGKEELDILSFIYRHAVPSGMDINAAYPEFRMTFSPFCMRNSLGSATALFYVLKYMYEDYFTFSRPMILAD